MSGIITSLPPLVQQPPGGASSYPAGLPGVTYTTAVLSLPQTWTAKQTFPLGNISVQAGDVVGLSSSATTDTTNANNITGGSQTGTGAMVRATSPTFLGTNTITPTANSLTPALNITQSGPTSGSSAGPFSYNLITVTDGGNTLTGSGLDAFNLLVNDSSAFRVNDTVSGTGPIRIAGTFAVNYTGVGPTAETVGVIGSSYSNATPGALWGTIGNAAVGPSGTVAALIGVASELSAQTGSSVVKRVGFLALTEGPVQGSSIDAAFVVAAESISGFGTPAGFKNVITISNNWFTGPALDPSGNFFNADSATTISNWANMSNVTVAGNIMLFPNFNVPGASAGFTLPAHVGAAFQYGNTNASGVQIEIDAFTGPPVFVGKRANTSSTSPSALLSGDTALALNAQPYDGAAYNGVANIIIGAAQNLTSSAHGSYMSFSTTPLNTTTVTEAGRFGPSGALLVGTTTDAAAGVVNVATGFRIGNAAASGNVLRGNGTNFVSSVFGVGDLGGAGTGVLAALGVNVGTAGAFVVNGGALGTPSSGVATNLTGTAAGLTAGNVTTNANLTGVITSVGNATSISSQTGTGTKFVVDTSPTIITPILATSFASPIHYGGSAAGSTATINGTSSGSPASAFLNLQSNGQNVSIGNTAPKTLLDINGNLSSSPTLVVPTSVQRVQAADNVSGGQEWVSYVGSNANTGNILSGAVAGGTSAAPAATGLGGVSQYMFNLRGYGYTGTSWQIGSIILMQNAGGVPWSGTNQGTLIDFYTTPVNSTTIANAMRLNASGGLSIGTTSDPGIGSIFQNSASFMMRTKTSWNTGAAAQTATLTNAPVAGNPTKWIPVDDNGVTRYIPAW